MGQGAEDANCTSGRLRRPFRLQGEGGGEVHVGNGPRLHLRMFEAVKT